MRSIQSCDISTEIGNFGAEDAAGKNAKRIEEYIRHQLDEDKAGEQLTMGNF